MLPPATCQVLVAGGGPAGLAAAIALAERGIDVSVVDPNPVEPATNRCEMLPVAAEAILARLGLADLVAKAVALQGVVSLWGTERPVDHAAANLGVSRHGWSVDRADLHSALKARCVKFGVNERAGRMRKIGGRPGAWQVAIGEQTTLRASYLVDATGRPAAVARRLGAQQTFGPPLVARIWTADTHAPPRLLVEALPEGWLYALPRPGGGSSAGHLAHHSNQAGLLASGHSVDMCTRLFNGSTVASDAVLADSRCSRLYPTVSRGWLATGDAAAAFDPIASQGLFNALSGGFFAGNAAADAITGNPSSVEVYRALTERTAQRSHRLIPRQYAVLPYKTPFWRRMAYQPVFGAGNDGDGVPAKDTVWPVEAPI